MQIQQLHCQIIVGIIPTAILVDTDEQHTMSK